MLDQVAHVSHRPRRARLQPCHGGHSFVLRQCGETLRILQAVAEWRTRLGAAGDKHPNGSYLAVCGGVYSWNDFVSTLNAQGHGVEVQQVSVDAYDTFFPGAPEVRETFQYFELCTYFGPEKESRIAAAKVLYPEGFIGFSDWAKRDLAPTKRSTITSTSP